MDTSGVGKHETKEKEMRKTANHRTVQPKAVAAATVRAWGVKNDNGDIVDVKMTRTAARALKLGKVVRVTVTEEV